MPLNEQAYEYIRKMIINNELTYGKIYSETRLAKEIGVSRTPFRDAVHRLAQEGYIDIIPSKGIVLHQLTVQDVEDTFQVRSALEGYCTFEITRQFQTVRARELFRELDRLLGCMREILESSRSIEDFSYYDFQFHIKIVHFLENHQLSVIFDTFVYRMQRLAALSLAHKGRMEDTYEEHAAILDAMRCGDLSHIYEITLRHMNTPRHINLEDLKTEAL